MRIGIDLRSLGNSPYTGVENYTVNIVEGLLKLDKKNQYVLFNSGLRKPPVFDFNFLNSINASSNIPNKVMNLMLKFKLKTVESFTGPLDYFFMPNPGVISTMPQTRLAVTVHDLSFLVAPEFYNFKRRLWHKFINFKTTCQKAKIIFAVSNYTKQDLVKIFNISPEKIIVAYPGLDSSEEGRNIPVEILRTVRNEYCLPGKYILFLNTIEPRKNLLSLIRAFELLEDEDCHLVIVGRKGWKYAEIFRQIKKSPKRNKILYLGYLAEKHKAAVIKLADALVYPSFYEGFGFQPLEAFALGTPAIVSQVTALPEVVGDAALLINPFNVSDLCKAISQTLNNQDLRVQLIEKGFKRVRNFTWQKTAEEMLGVFNNRL